MRRTKNGPIFHLICLGLCLTLLPRRALAQDAYSCIDRLSDHDVQRRLMFVEASLESGKRRARIWWYGWTTFAVGATAATWGLYGLSRDDPREVRDSALVGALGSSLMLAQLVAFPLVPAFAPQRLARLPERTPEQRREKLRVATRYLERSAVRERRLRGVVAHLGGPLFALGTGTFIAVRHDEPLASLQAFLAPPIIGEARVLTLPRRAILDWRQYRSFACPPSASSPPSPDIDRSAVDETRGARTWSIIPAPGGLGLRLQF